MAFVVAMLGSVTTLVGASDRFGLAGAMLLVALLFLVVGALYVSQRSSILRRYWSWAKGFGEVPWHFFIVAGGVAT
ncbi:hypothetical protein, partial [Stieleria mannarensis]|uniref:hypothetical protein n=1 Tax=Stieleria mannarensis TaxID=2755585 RepID=UPI0015FF0C26